MNWDSIKAIRKKDRKRYRRLKELVDSIHEGGDVEFFFNVLAWRTDHHDNVFLPIGHLVRSTEKQEEKENYIIGPTVKPSYFRAQLLKETVQKTLPEVLNH